MSTTVAPVTGAELLELFCRYAFGCRQERAEAAALLADALDGFGRPAHADALRAAPTLTTIPNLLRLAAPLEPPAAGRLAGKLLAGRLTPEAVREMLAQLHADGRGDLAAWCGAELRRPEPPSHAYGPAAPAVGFSADGRPPAGGLAPAGGRMAPEAGPIPAPADGPIPTERGGTGETPCTRDCC